MTEKLGDSSRIRNVGIALPEDLHARCRAVTFATGLPVSQLAARAMARAVAELEAANGGPFPVVEGRLPYSPAPEFRRRRKATASDSNQGPGDASLVR